MTSVIWLQCFTSRLDTSVARGLCYTCFKHDFHRLSIYYWLENIHHCSLDYEHEPFCRYFVMTAVHNWQGFPTWISRLEEFVQNAQRLSEKVLQILCLTLLILLLYVLSRNFKKFPRGFTDNFCWKIWVFFFKFVRCTTIFTDLPLWNLIKPPFVI